ncbi:calcyclin-binding protein-like [Diadema setosum]|uniref:calcyclin-binding protein-like n=1 Tax=Diadema setosum TaxID=31175 RepID=UPI003B3BE1C3
MAQPREELELDCEELKRLLELTERESVKTLLGKEIQDVEGRLQGLDNVSVREPPSEKREDPVVAMKPSETKKIAVSQLPTKTITSYGWDQSPKFVKVYITLNGVQTLAKEAVSVEYTSRSFTLKVTQKDCIHQLTINSLLHSLIAEKSYHKVKTDNLVILLKKEVEKNWDYLTQTEAKVKSKKQPPSAADTSDPSAGIMNMMKQMYDEGDDEMKRTIAKAWTEARDKKGTMDLP